jgi:hypothetical protein
MDRILSEVAGGKCLFFDGILLLWFGTEMCMISLFFNWEDARKLGKYLRIGIGWTWILVQRCWALVDFDESKWS